MARQCPAKSRARRMLSMVDDAINLPCNGDFEDTKKVTIWKSVEDVNLTGTHSPTLQCLSPNFDLQSHLLQSPSTISYQSAIFDNVDFVASPTLVFSTPRHRKRRFEENRDSRSIEYYNVCESTDLITLSDTTMPQATSELQVPETCETTPQEENIQYITLETVREEFTIDQNILYTTPVDNDDNSNILILQCEKTAVESNGYNNTLNLDADILLENQSTMIENVNSEFHDCNQTTTIESVPSISDVLLTTKELTRKKRRYEENWEKAIFEEFWKLSDHEDQWHYILRHINTKDIKKMQLIRTKNRTQTISYFFKINGTESINVCKNFFLNTLSISEKTVYTAIEKGKTEEVKDNRGQHENRPRKMSVSTEQSVIAHIKQFPVKESHYVRRDSKKLYLEETLNISKMYRLYSDEWFKSANHPNDVKMATKRQYETVFNTKFNYSFHKPKKDMCGQCTLYRQADGERKDQLQEVYTKHIRNKECVRELKTKDKIEVDSTTTVVAIYDLEKVLTIPQSEVGIFHYKRKYPIYNFTIYNSLSGRGYCYLWHYQVAKRGANEIGSCVLNFIETESQRGIKNFIFYSDGCAGQNKNRIIFALYLYLCKKYGVNIIHRYFETGHSQSEGDSMHSLIERAKKNHTIYTPEQMYGLIMNAKINGEKFHLKEMEQHNFFDLKEIMDRRHWLRTDQTSEKVMWTKIHEIMINRAHPDVIYLKYNFDDEYISLNTAPNSRSSRGRPKKTLVTDVSGDELRNLYREPIALPKPLYDDLMSLCKSVAIPKYYHNFYNNLHCVENSEEVIDDIESDDSN
ncbi:unnamed protein product [Chilo suppressalis]|uniref:DUF7869 domain-containing protein n=1 Tax=Chilo suppressalis TaxID=168631 RepID=A0ABN8AXP9_CHISP|nr:unnamed protein product [Chilo suppressalis]